MKNSIKKTGLLFVLLIIIAGLTSFYIKDEAEIDTSPALGKGEVFPSFAMPDFRSETVHLDSVLANKRLVWVNFWTTDCQLCRSEIRIMSSLYSKYKQKGLEIIAINVEEEKDLIKEYLNLYPVPFKVLMDSQGELAEELRVKDLPISFLIDSTGIVKEYAKGIQSQWMSELDKRLAEGY